MMVSTPCTRQVRIWSYNIIVVTKKPTGSTGVPKGVDVKHSTMTNALLLEPGRLRLTVGSKVGQVLSISFAMGKEVFAEHTILC